MLSARALLGSSAAVGVGALAVAVGAQVVEGSNPAPIFSLKAERFDLSTMKGRFAKQLTNCDPSLLIAREPEINAAVCLLKKFEEGTIDRSIISDEQLWSARKLAESAVHPDTKEIIPEPFRMSGYVPFNGPVCVSMMASGGTAGLLFWNWANQSQNALVNYFNRNASAPTTDKDLAISYCGAVGAALVVAFGLSTGIKRVCSPAKAQQMMKFVAFPSSIVASCSNCYIMRSPEIKSGSSVTDKAGNVLAEGKRSSIAARKAVEETVMSRGILQVPVFLFPAITMSLPPVAALCAANPAVTLPLTTLITIMSFGFGLPAAVAYFPQIGSLSTTDLEPELREAIGELGIDTVYYNKGL